MQHNNSHIKQQINSCKAHKYKNTNLYYRGSYEFDFLEKFIEKYPDIQNCPSIKYFYENKTKMYFSDFYILSLNLIVEIKNSYLAEKDKNKIEAKKRALFKLGYSFIMIIDKNYDELLFVN